MSSLAEVEPFLINVCAKLARMGQPLNKEQVITLANDVIEGTDVEKRLEEHKKRHAVATSTTTVGKRWCANFTKRHSAVSKRSQTRVADAKRIQYITRDNFETMYDNIYHRMVEAIMGFKDYVKYNLYHLAASFAHSRCCSSLP